MKRGLLLFLAVALTAIAAEPTNEGFKAFRTVRVRNIFDPTRRADPASESAARPVTPPTTTISTKPPFFALTGTLVRPERALGFFTGSSSDYMRVIAPGESIGNFKVRTITIAGAELEQGGKSFTLPVGQQVPLSGTGLGTAQPYVPEPSATPPAPTPEAPTPTMATAPVMAPSSAALPISITPENAKEILKRLKERRRKEER